MVIVLLFYLINLSIRHDVIIVCKQNVRASDSWAYHMHRRQIRLGYLGYISFGMRRAYARWH
jgi:hypothetical protein